MAITFFWAISHTKHCRYDFHSRFLHVVNKVSNSWQNNENIEMYDDEVDSSLVKPSYMYIAMEITIKKYILHNSHSLLVSYLISNNVYQM